MCVCVVNLRAGAPVSAGGMRELTAHCATVLTHVAQVTVAHVAVTVDVILAPATLVTVDVKTVIH